jgi:glycosyltransferase involved in cell wall biosynthesis
MMLYKVVSHMDRAYFENVVVSMVETGPVGQKIQALGIPVYSLGMSSGRPTLPGWRKLFSLLRQEKPFILQTWMYHADLLGLLTGRMVKVNRIVWNVRCSNMQNLSRMTGWTIQACAKLSGRPDAVIINAQTSQQYHASLGYHPRRWEVIPNGFDMAHFKPDVAARNELRAELKLADDILLVGLIGRYDPMKDHQNFLLAARLLAKACARVHFLLAGRDVDQANFTLMRLIKELKLQEVVHLIGERDDMPKVMNALDIATSSSAYGEGFPNVVGEVMACEVPCVVTDVGDSARIVGVSGVVVPPGNPQALAGGWQELIEAGPEGRKRLGKLARERINRNYSLEKIVQNYENLYYSLKGS